MNRAGRACLVARQFEDRSRTDREQRQAWAALVAQVPLDPDALVILCAICHRVRGASGWTVLPAGIEQRLMTWDRASVSHSFCPDCQHRMTLPDWLAVEEHAAC